MGTWERNKTHTTPDSHDLSTNKHQTAMIFARMDGVAKSILQAWLDRYPQHPGAPLYDQGSFNELLPTYAFGMEVFASYLLGDPVTKGLGRRSVDACRYILDYNTNVLRNALKEGGSQVVNMFVHRHRRKY